MIALPDKLIETPEQGGAPNGHPRRDLVLAAPERRRGHRRRIHAATIACMAQFTPDHFAPFFPSPDKLIGYHYVRSGRMVSRSKGSRRWRSGPGGIAILPRNDPHPAGESRACPRPTRARSAGSPPTGVHRVEKRHRWAEDRGVVRLSRRGPRARAPAARSLPALLTLNAAAGEAQWLDSSMRFRPRSSRRRKSSRGWPSCSWPRRSATMSTICRRSEGLAARAGRPGGVQGAVDHPQALCRGARRRRLAREAACRARCWASASPS